MNKAQLVDAVADLAGLTKKEAANALDALTQTITLVLSEGDDISLVGFGRFHVVDVAERMGRNPQTGEALKIEAKKKVMFKAGLSLKSAL